jgi:hypothetical protein
MAFTASSWGQGLLLTGLSPGSSETGFEAVITKANLPTSALDTGSLSCLNGGGDWRFSTDINGSTQLPVDIVTCVTNASAGSTKFIAWVRFPTYASGTRSVYAFWNKAGESQPAASAAFGSEDVWQDNESAWHLDDLTDSAGNATSLTTVGSPTTVDGVVGDGKRFASNPHYLYTSTVGVVEDDSFNITFWYKRQTGDVNQNGAFIGIADNSSPFNNFGVFSATRSTVNLAIQIYSRDTDSSPIDAFEIPSFSAGDSVFISVNQNSSGSTIVGIHNGTTYTGTSTARLLGTTPDRLSFNRVMDSSPEGGSQNVLDEVRLTSPGNTKSSDRIELEYDNQSSPSSFWTAGAVFVPGGSSISVTKTLNITSSFLQSLISLKTIEVTIRQKETVDLNITTSLLNQLEATFNINLHLNQRINKTSSIITALKISVNDDILIQTAFNITVSEFKNINTGFLQQTTEIKNITFALNGVQPLLVHGATFRLSVIEPSYKFTIKG